MAGEPPSPDATKLNPNSLKISCALQKSSKLVSESVGLTSWSPIFEAFSIIPILLSERDNGLHCPPHVSVPVSRCLSVCHHAAVLLFLWLSGPPPCSSSNLFFKSSRLSIRQWLRTLRTTYWFPVHIRRGCSIRPAGRCLHVSASWRNPLDRTLGWRDTDHSNTGICHRVRAPSPEDNNLCIHQGRIRRCRFL